MNESGSYGITKLQNALEEEEGGRKDDLYSLLSINHSGYLY